MEIRTNLKIEGIQYIWETNLTDEEIKSLFYELKKSRTLMMETFAANHSTLEFRGGRKSFKTTCGDFTIRGHITETTILAIKENTKEIQKIQAEIDNESILKLQKSEERKKNLERYKRLITLVVKSCDRGMYEESIRLLGECAKLDKEFYFNSWDRKLTVNYHYFRISALTDNVELGLSRIHHNSSHLLIDLAQFFEAVKNYKQAEQIYQMGIKEDNPNLGSFYKRYAICLENQKKYQEAISLCEKALLAGLECDGTKGGFRGRLLRLEKKNKREESGYSAE